MSTRILPAQSPPFGDAAVPSSIWSELIATETGCWLWQGSMARTGYGLTHGKDKAEYIHRAMFEVLVEPIPDGLELDHLCRQRACANPAHLEPVTHRENVLRSPTALAAINARKTRCKRGHPFAINAAAGRRRECRACVNDRRRQRLATDPEYAERVRRQRREADRRYYARTRRAAA